MTKSYNLNRFPDADYTPNDMGPPERLYADPDHVIDEDGMLDDRIEFGEQLLREREELDDTVI